MLSGIVVFLVSLQIVMILSRPAMAGHFSTGRLDLFLSGRRTIMTAHLALSRTVFDTLPMISRASQSAMRVTLSHRSDVVGE